MYRLFFKRLIDIIVSISALIILSPILLVVIILLNFFNKGAGVFFIQQRPGKDCRKFSMYKFKTMTDRRDSQGDLLPDILRLTKIGRLIRLTSFDETLQLINVVKGDMSIIGPRPLLIEYLPLYSKEQSRRHEIRPGITGWAQVNGRNNMKFSKRFEFDVWYVDNLTFILDFKILIMSIGKVLTYNGVVSEDNVEDIDDLDFLRKINHCNRKKDNNRN